MKQGGEGEKREAKDTDTELSKCALLEVGFAQRSSFVPHQHVMRNSLFLKSSPPRLGNSMVIRRF